MNIPNFLAEIFNLHTSSQKIKNFLHLWLALVNPVVRVQADHTALPLHHHGLLPCHVLCQVGSAGKQWFKLGLSSHIQHSPRQVRGILAIPTVTIGFFIPAFVAPAFFYQLLYFLCPFSPQVQQSSSLPALALVPLSSPSWTWNTQTSCAPWLSSICRFSGPSWYHQSTPWSQTFSAGPPLTWFPQGRPSALQLCKFRLNVVLLLLNVLPWRPPTCWSGWSPASHLEYLP